jgi:hypothetical protein
VRLDRKLLLIAPAIVLVFVAAGMVYAATQLQVLASVSDTWKERSDFLGSVERNEKPLDPTKAVGLLRVALEVESRRTAAITASRDLMLVLATVALVACGVLVIGIRSVPRQHWPRFTIGRSSDAP